VRAGPRPTAGQGRRRSARTRQEDGVIDGIVAHACFASPRPPEAAGRPAVTGVTVTAAGGGVQVERRGALAVLRLDRPRLNLLDQALRAALGETLRGLDATPGIHAVVFASGPEHFCAGADLNEFCARRDPAIARQHCRNAHSMIRALLGLRMPVIAAIEGACLGGGFELALGCDWRVAATDARIGLPEVGRGVFPGTGGVPLLVRQIGAARAKDLLWRAAVLSGAEAEAVGLVEQAAPPGGAEATAIAIADRLASCSAVAVAAAKRMADGIFLNAFEAHLAEEEEAYLRVFAAEDVGEGVRAFRERRAPVWSHR
jgi:enoyl-CoA hydratase/carnithine racemase